MKWRTIFWIWVVIVILLAFQGTYRLYQDIETGVASCAPLTNELYSVVCFSGPGYDLINRLVFSYLLYIAPVQIVAWLVRRRKPKVVDGGEQREGVTK